MGHDTPHTARLLPQGFSDVHPIADGGVAEAMCRVVSEGKGPGSGHQEPLERRLEGVGETVWSGGCQEGNWEKGKRGLQLQCTEGVEGGERTSPCEGGHPVRDLTDPLN